MENKKTIIGIIIVIVLIIALVIVSYLYSEFSNKQLNILKEETNTILQSNIVTDEINSEIKADKNFGIVEKAIKEYTSEIRNKYIEINKIDSELNPNEIFSAEKLQDSNMDDINKIIAEYKNQTQKISLECKEQIKEENIIKNIESQNIKQRKNYYEDLYKTIMLSETMKKQYETITSEIDKKEQQIYNKLEKLKNIEKYLKNNKEFWTINDNKVQFSNISKMTEYYNLVNELLD